jgi:hypothetical protein
LNVPENVIEDEAEAFLISWFPINGVPTKFIKLIEAAELTSVVPV